MKKTISLVIAILMIVGCCVTAFADTTGVENQVTVKDVDDELYEGEWASISDDVQMYIPTGFVLSETSEEGVLAYYVEAETGRTITVVKLATTETLEEMIKSLIDAGLQDKLVRLDLNGMAGYSLMTEEGSLVVVVEVNDEFIQITFTGADDEDYQPLIENMVKSISLDK